MSLSAYCIDTNLLIIEQENMSQRAQSNIHARNSDHTSTKTVAPSSKIHFMLQLVIKKQDDIKKRGTFMITWLREGC